MPYFVYILQCADDSYYTGMTTDLTARLTEHETVPPQILHLQPSSSKIGLARFVSFGKTKKLFAQHH